MGEIYVEHKVEQIEAHQLANRETLTQLQADLAALAAETERQQKELNRFQVENQSLRLECNALHRRLGADPANDPISSAYLGKDDPEPASA